MLPAISIATPSGQLSFLKAGSGPAVVVIHGVGGHKEDWTSLMMALSSGHTVYAVDMIGFGASSKTAPEITIATQAEAVVALLDAEHIGKADLVGNSVGGWVAVLVSSTEPEY